MELIVINSAAENSTKLYGEFWGIFATNVTNNLNTIKLYNLGEKLNKYLNEIIKEKILPERNPIMIPEMYISLIRINNDIKKVLWMEFISI